MSTTDQFSRLTSQFSRLTSHYSRTAPQGIRPRVRVPSYIALGQQGYTVNQLATTVPSKARARMRDYIATGNTAMRDTLLSEWVRRYGKDLALRTYSLDHHRAKDCTRMGYLRMAKERYVSKDTWKGYTEQLYTIPKPMAGRVYTI